MDIKPGYVFITMSSNNWNGLGVIPADVMAVVLSPIEKKPENSGFMSVYLSFIGYGTYEFWIGRLTDFNYFKKIDYELTLLEKLVYSVPLENI